MPFFLIPILVGLGGWLATAGIGSILTAAAGAFILSWLVAHIIIPIGIVLGLFTIGFLMFYYGMQERGKKWGNWKVWGGTISLIFGFIAFSNFFLNYKLIPGVFSVAMPTTSLSLAESASIVPGVVEIVPPFNYIIIFITLYVLFRVVKRRR